MSYAMRQPRLRDHWGCENFGKAETATGDVWWYSVKQDDGTVKRYPLIPMEVVVGPITKKPA
jgi:hypothetical protein